MSWSRKHNIRKGRGRTAGGCGGLETAYRERSPQPERITPEWAVERMSDHIGYALDSLVQAEMIRPDDRADYEQELKCKVSVAARSYSAERRNAMGRTSSAVHYLTVVVDNAIVNITVAISRYFRGDREVPLSAMESEDAASYGWDSAPLLGDSSRSVRDLVFALDMATMRGMLTPRQDEAFMMLFDGHTHREVQSEIGVFGGSFYRKVLEPIRSVCSKCGYGPSGRCYPVGITASCATDRMRALSTGTEVRA